MRSVVSKTIVTTLISGFLFSPLPVGAAPAVQASGYSVSLLAGGLQYPGNGLVYRSGKDDLLVTENGNNRVDRIDLATDAVSTFATVQYPDEMAIGPNGDIYVTTHSTGGPISRLDSDGNLLNTISTPDFPTGIALDAKNNLYVADAVNGSIWQYVAGTSSSPVVFATGIPSLEGLQFSPNGQLFAVSHGAAGIGAIYQVTSGANAVIAPIRWASGLTLPTNLAFDPISGDVFTADSSGTLYRISSPGVQSTFATGLSASSDGIYALAFDADGNLYIDDYAAGQVWTISQKTTIPNVVSFTAPYTSCDTEFSTNPTPAKNDRAVMANGFSYATGSCDAATGSFEYKDVTFGGLKGGIDLFAPGSLPPPSQEARTQSTMAIQYTPEFTGNVRIDADLTINGREDASAGSGMAAAIDANDQVKEELVDHVLGDQLSALLKIIQAETKPSAANTEITAIIRVDGASGGGATTLTRAFAEFPVPGPPWQEKSYAGQKVSLSTSIAVTQGQPITISVGAESFAQSWVCATAIVDLSKTSSSVDAVRLTRL